MITCDDIERKCEEGKDFYYGFLYQFLWCLSIVVCVFLFITISNLNDLETIETPIFVSAEDVGDENNFVPLKGSMIYSPCVYHKGNYSTSSNHTCPENFELYETNEFCYSLETNCSLANYTACYPRLYENSTIVENTGGLVVEYPYFPKFKNLIVLQNIFVAFICAILFLENARLLLHYLRQYYLKYHQKDYYNLENNETQSLLLPKTIYRTLSIKIRMPVNLCFLFGCHIPHEEDKLLEEDNKRIVNSFIYTGIFWIGILIVIFAGSAYFVYVGHSLSTAFMTDMLNEHCFAARDNIMHHIMVLKHVYVWLIILLSAITFPRVVTLYTILTSDLA